MAALTMVRVPGSRVPTLRCQGHLTLDTGESLRREIALSTRNGDPGVVINLDRLQALDQDGAAVLLELAEQASGRGKRLLLVAGAPFARTLLIEAGVDPSLGVFDSESLAFERLDP